MTDPATLRAMGAVRRHLFVPEGSRSSAYDDRPLPIGYGQTISQPYIVALMTEALQLLGIAELGRGETGEVIVFDLGGSVIAVLEKRSGRFAASNSSS